MTSPHLAADEEVVATSATANLDDNPPNQDLTAEDNAARPAHDSPPLGSSLTVTGDEPRKQMLNGDEAVGQEMGQTSQPPATAEPAIPQTPPSNGDHDYNMQAPMSMTQMSQMDALSAMMAYSNPQLGYDAMNVPGMGMGLADGLPMDNSLIAQAGYLASSPYAREPDETRISAYAMLEFDDGQFYMNTYSVILGRDLVAARAAMRRDEEAQTAEGAEPRTPVRIKREESRYTKSIVSESGGILREGCDSDSDERARRRKHRKASKKSRSTGSSSQHDAAAAKNASAQPQARIDYQPQSQVRRRAPNQEVGAAVDPASLRPSPYDCPLVGIHPPATTDAGAYKSISRRHVKIAYNSKKNFFEAEIIGRNGAFVDDEFYYHNDVIPLKSGSLLQIGGVVVKFVLPDVALGQTGAEHQAENDDNAVAARYSEGGKEMSFDFEDTPREGALLKDTSEEESEEGEDSGAQNDGLDEEERDEVGDDGDGEEDDNGEEEEEEVQENGERLHGSDEEDDREDGDEEEDEEAEEDGEQLIEPIQRAEKRKGPGRPPKNGIMSKREQQLLKREAEQRAAKKTISGAGGTEKNKVGRPRKHPKADSPPIKTEKRKYTKRKPKDPDAVVKREGSGDEQPAKEKKDKKPAKPPRSPSPVFNEADLTPEQLAKPSANYVTLIHEALSNSETGQMSLPQIYRAIQRRYPFFVLKCNTNGWQSSVRHNLSQHTAFRKVERDGKGWMWAIVDGVSIEKEKKRRPTPPLQMPPHMHHQQIYSAAQHMMPGHPGMMGPPQGYMNGSMPPNIRPGHPPQYPMAGQPMNGYPMPPPGYGPPVPPPQPLAPQTATYSSPYAPKPTANPTAQPPPSNMKPENRHPGSHTPVHHPSGHFIQQQMLHPQAQPGPPPGPPRLSDQVTRAVEKFSTTLVTSLKGKSNNAEAVVASAVNRVLGITNQSTVPGDPHEEKILAALRSIVAKVSAQNAHHPPPQQGRPQGPPPQQGPLPPSSHQGRISQGPPNQQGPPPSPHQPQVQGPMGIGHSAAPSNARLTPSAPAVPRPNFSGPSQSRPSMGAVPRPPMMTPGMKRANSGSPASNPSHHGAPPTTAVSPAVVSTPSPAPVTNGTDLTGDGNTTTESGQVKINVPQPASAGENMNDNGKRPLSEEVGDDLAERESKRLSTMGPTPLKA